MGPSQTYEVTDSSGTQGLVLTNFPFVDNIKSVARLIFLVPETDLYWPTLKPPVALFNLQNKVKMTQGEI